MPNYEYKCNQCGKNWDEFHLIKDRNSVKCCGLDVGIVPGCYIDVFKPMVYEDIDVEPIMVTSKRQLREECKRHGVISARLE